MSSFHGLAGIGHKSIRPEDQKSIFYPICIVLVATVRAPISNRKFLVTVARVGSNFPLLPVRRTSAKFHLRVLNSNPSLKQLQFTFQQNTITIFDAIFLKIVNVFICFNSFLPRYTI